MKWDEEGDVDMSHVSDDRSSSGGSGGGGFGGLGGGGGMGGLRLPHVGGIAGVVLAIVAMFVVPKLLGGGGFNINAADLPGSVATDNTGAVVTAPQDAALAPNAKPTDKQAKFAVWVFNDVQKVWQKEFTQANRTYNDATMKLYTDATNTACGQGEAAMGPFYCPGDSTVYLDLNFYSQLAKDFNAPGDFAQAYVIAHEMGHHVQNELGISTEVSKLQRQNPDDALQLSVRLELQADCLAGVWAHSVYTDDSADRGLSDGDIDEGIRAAKSVGDDTIQQRTTGHINQETWTHGSAEQRVKWFRTGFDSGESSKCDTFAVDEP